MQTEVSRPGHPYSETAASKWRLASDHERWSHGKQNFWVRYEFQGSLMTMYQWYCLNSEGLQNPSQGQGMAGAVHQQASLKAGDFCQEMEKGELCMCWRKVDSTGVSAWKAASCKAATAIRRSHRDIPGGGSLKLSPEPTYRVSDTQAATDICSRSSCLCSRDLELQRDQHPCKNLLSSTRICYQPFCVVARMFQKSDHQKKTGAKEMRVTWQTREEQELGFDENRESRTYP